MNTYLHLNGTIHAKRGVTAGDLEAAIQSVFRQEDHEEQMFLMRLIDPNDAVIGYDP
jgi:hypothetical protein